MSQIKQSTAFTKLFLMVSSTDHFTPVTGITPVVAISKAGAAFGAAAGTVTEIANGWYKIVYTTVDVGILGELGGHATGTGADPTDFSDQVVAYDPSASTNLGLTNLDAAISSRGTSSYAGADTSGTTTLLTRIPGTVAAQTGDAFARLGAPAGASIAADIAGLPALVWNALTSAMTTAGSIGLKLKNWVLGTDNKALVSTDAGNIVTLSTADEGVLGHLATMINGTPAFTTAALANAPSGGGGSAPTVIQIRQEMDSNSTQLAAIAAKTNALSATPAADVVTATMAHLIETGVTLQQWYEIIGSVIAGNATSAGAFKAVGNGSTPRVAATLDGTGNRTVTVTP